MAEHVLSFTLENVTDWEDAEDRAAQIVRSYTLANRRGRGAVSDEAQLANATFRLNSMDDGTWAGVCEVMV